jgi:uncharacterized SAM-binding protein YcdF (DUF218 family)
LFSSIRRQAGHDETHPADAIVVFGAAEYDGKPSPVFQARLDHAFDLQIRGLAPLVIVTGGSGGDPHFTEGGVGKDYLVQRGIATEKIVAETRSESTYENVTAVAGILRQQGARSCLAVSDGFHLYRIKLMMTAQGILTYSSPVPHSLIESDPVMRTLYTLRELVPTSLWYLGIHV